VVHAITPASSVKKVEPIYPEVARNNNVSGSVVVEVTVDERGKVIQSAALSGPLILKQAAIDAAKQWKFEPAISNGKPAQFITRITFNFIRER
jgi:protein TonB